MLHLHTLAASYSWKQQSRIHLPHTTLSVDMSAAVFNQRIVEWRFIYALVNQCSKADRKEHCNISTRHATVRMFHLSSMRPIQFSQLKKPSDLKKSVLHKKKVGGIGECTINHISGWCQKLMAELSCFIYPVTFSGCLWCKREMSSPVPQLSVDQHRSFTNYL